MFAVFPENDVDVSTSAQFFAQFHGNAEGNDVVSLTVDQADLGSDGNEVGKPSKMRQLPLLPRLRKRLSALEEYSVHFGLLPVVNSNDVRRRLFGKSELQVYSN